MRTSFTTLSLLLAPCVALADDGASRSDNTVVIDAVSETNLGIRTEEAEEADFRSLLSVPGVIGHTCESHSIVSSRIAGRFVEVMVHEGDRVDADQIVARIESRQPGGTPPVVDLRAPAPGLVVESRVHLGGPVEPGAGLMDVFDLSKVWAVARVPQHDAGFLSGEPLAQVVVPAAGEQQLEARFVRQGVEADALKGTLEVVFELPNPDYLLRPGMRAELSIVTKERHGVLSIPRLALQGGPADRFVFIRDYELDHAFVRVPVEVGEFSGGRVEILSGLFPGDEVVTNGAYGLAFAGKGTASLKEALDAAHGHSHNEDGSEMTAEQLAAAGDGHGHDHGHHEPSRAVWFLAAACVVLMLLLIASPFLNRSRSPQP